MSHTWIELDPDVCSDNIRALQAVAAGAEILPVVKSNAYNHGLDMVSKTAWDTGIRSFVVGNVEEASFLRTILPDAGVIVIGVTGASDVETIVRLKITPVLFTDAQARAVAEVAGKKSLVVECHAKVDTGMGRMGFPWERFGETLKKLADLSGIRITGLCTHFASGPADGDFAVEQAWRFKAAIAEAKKLGMGNLFCHASNSAALKDEASWDFDGIRPGIILYGYGGVGRRGIITRPFLQWKTRLIQVKEVPAGFPVSYDSTWTAPHRTRLGTIDVGYADGFSRSLSNAGCVLVRGRRCPVVGRVTMNYTMVDLGQDSQASEGDEAVLIGQDGGLEIWADEMARWRNTIPYEVLTDIKTSDRRIKQK